MMVTENEKIGMRDTDERLETLRKDERRGRDAKDVRSERRWRERRRKDELKKKKRETWVLWKNRLERLKKGRIRGMSRVLKCKGGKRGRGYVSSKGLSEIRLLFQRGR